MKFPIRTFSFKFYYFFGLHNSWLNNSNIVLLQFRFFPSPIYVHMYGCTRFNCPLLLCFFFLFYDAKDNTEDDFDVADDTNKQTKHVKHSTCCASINTTWGRSLLGHFKFFVISWERLLLFIYLFIFFFNNN